jgi:hypothetical protein
LSIIIKNRSRSFIKFILFDLLIIINLLPTYGQIYNRGIGIYPGNPAENFSPSLKIDKEKYRNIALFKPVYSSSNYDFNLTAQLITDGIIESKMPGWIVTKTNDGILPRSEREYFIDRNAGTKKEFSGPDVWIQIELAGNSVIPDVDGLYFSGSVSVDTMQKEIKPWKISAYGSDDGKKWEILGELTNDQLIGDTLADYRRAIYPINYRIFGFRIKLNEPVHYKFYRAELNSPNILAWRIAEFAMTKDNKYCNIGGPYNFSSAWKSLGSKREWIYVDLGSLCSFNKIKLYWLKPAAAGLVEVSDDAKNWRVISSLPDDSSLTNNIIFPKYINGRYVRLNLDSAVSKEDSYILSEMEVFGTGAKYAVPHIQAKIARNGNLILSGGAWRLQRFPLIPDDIKEISKIGFNDSSWIVATVPGTALISYLNDGMIPDPNYSDNQLLISDSYFCSDFIYRDEFIVPKFYMSKRVFLNFKGINWKAKVYLNGKELGMIKGAFTRAEFDVTDDIVPGKKNAIAIIIYKNDSPGFVKEPTLENHGANGGELGLDNPTFQASVGWDWFPSIRGRNIGIWNDVFFSTSGDVTIKDPLITSKLSLPDTDSADLNIHVTLVNHSSENISGILEGKIGTVKFETPVSLSPLETKTLNLDSSTISALHFINPKLWWPNGYGQQNLYDVKLEFVSTDGSISDKKEFKIGIREISYSENGRALKLWVNGKRFIARGGDWGFSESNLRYRSREYDIAIRHQKEMNLNMTRNWVGQTGDDEFYEACDKYGILVWQDFWLANPGDGPNPEDHGMFMQNVDDFVKRIRNHPSIALYCGRNEGYPPQDIDESIRKLLSKTAPGICYISSSADGIVSGHGPYHVEPLKYYFAERATRLFHTEIGLPSPVSIESLRMMLPDSALWPINRLWGVHDFSLESAQSGKTFIEMVKNNFGNINNAKEWLEYSQWISYQDYRAIIEAQSKNRMGILIWMTHPAWPSLVFQTYDYYFEPTGAFFGCKKGSEPLHIQWNAYTDSVEVVNYSVQDGKDLTAFVKIFNLDGTEKLNQKFTLDCPIDRRYLVCKIEKPKGLSRVYFIRLKLERGKKLISENFYWSGLKEDDYTAIDSLPKVKLNLTTRAKMQNGKWYLITELYNKTKTPALMVKLKVIGNKDRKRIEPVIFSDNFVSLMPGEKRKIKIELNNPDTRGTKPVVVVEGVNIE